MITKTIERHSPRIGMESCVGILSNNYPLSFGNYFWLSDGLRIINMWSENLREFVRRNNIIDIECTVFSDGKHKLGIVSDPIIPKEWLIQNKVCITGCGWGSRELCEYILTHQGLSIENHICGCEKPEQSPSLTTMFSFNSRETTYFCHYCKRKWVS